MSALLMTLGSSGWMFFCDRYRARVRVMSSSPVMKRKKSDGVGFMVLYEMGFQAALGLCRSSLKIMRFFG